MALEDTFPSPQISCFSKESYFFLLENSIRIPEMWFLLLIPQGYVCVYTNPYVYKSNIFLYITTHIYTKLNMSSQWCPVLIIYHMDHSSFLPSHIVTCRSYSEKPGLLPLPSIAYSSSPVHSDTAIRIIIAPLSCKGKYFID